MRLAFVALSLAAGIGVLAYLVAVLVSVEPEQGAPAPAAAGTSVRQALAVGLIVLGVLLLLRASGLWFGDRVVWPVVLVALGSAVIWTRGDEVDRTRWSALMRRLPEGSQRALTGSAPRVRLGIAALLIAAGLAQFLIWSGPDGVRRNAPLAALATLVGVAVIAGPWFWRAGPPAGGGAPAADPLAEERAEVAAHLHDSVLQTLALIQRSGEPREMTTLARGAGARAAVAGCSGGARAADHSLLSTRHERRGRRGGAARTASPIDVVTTGDCRLDEPVHALVLAAREAMVERGHALGRRAMSVYVETDANEVSALRARPGQRLRPRGRPADRRGIADSIEGRIARYGGEGRGPLDPRRRHRGPPARPRGRRP